MKDICVTRHVVHSFVEFTNKWRFDFTTLLLNCYLFLFTNVGVKWIKIHYNDLSRLRFILWSRTQRLHQMLAICKCYEIFRNNDSKLCK